MSAKVTSADLFARAQAVIPGGVNSPVRACKSVGADPIFIAAAKGSTLVDVEGKTYVDYVLSWGPMILGHGHPEVLRAARQAIELGTSFGAPTEGEIILAEKIREIMPSMEMVRMVNSGTEATMSALRLARGFTGRNKVIKFEGCYHGHCDAFLASAGSGLATLSIPGTPGVPAEVVGHTLLCAYNHLDQVEELFKRHGDDVAAVIVEPVAGNMGLVNPAEGFLKGLRELCDRFGALLIFDEVITGFRVALGGAQGAYGITPDLTCLGKIIGGGFPVGAYGGRKDVMARIAPCGDVYQAGTLSGNPVAMATGAATLDVLKRSDYGLLATRTQNLAVAMVKELQAKGLAVELNVCASLFTIYFTETPVTDFASAKRMDTARYGEFWRHMLSEGVYLAPAGYEAAFLSFAHSHEDLNKTLAATKSYQPGN